MMICPKPITIGLATVPCGQCKACRINRKRDWQSRLLLESAVSKFSAFITLTYKHPEGVKQNDYTFFCNRSDIQKFFKRLRRTTGFQIRYLAVAEYGEVSFRAHYHALVFSEFPILQSTFAQSWGLGHVDVGDVQPESIDYCLAYVLKSRRSLVDLPTDRPERTWPNFRLVSQGIGKASFDSLLIHDEDGVLRLPREYRCMGRVWPTPKYILKKGKELGYEITNTKANIQAEAEMLALRTLQETHQITPEVAQQMFHELRKKKLALQHSKQISAYYRLLHQHERERHETY